MLLHVSVVGFFSLLGHIEVFLCEYIPAGLSLLRSWACGFFLVWDCYEGCCYEHSSSVQVFCRHTHSFPSGLSPGAELLGPGVSACLALGHGCQTLFRSDSTWVSSHQVLDERCSYFPFHSCLLINPRNTGC